MIKEKINELRTNHDSRTFVLTFFVDFFYFVYAIYNGVLGIMLTSLWYGSICGYYLLLICVRSIVLFGDYKTKNNGKEKPYVLASYFLLLIFTSAMLTPIIVMLQNRRTFDLGLIPAIALATYTTYSVVTAIINIVKTRNSQNIFIKLIRLINIIAALMAIAEIQNTLILTNGGYSSPLQISSLIVSIVIIALSLVFLTCSFVGYLKKINRKNI